MKYVCHECDVKCIKLGKLTWAGHVFRMKVILQRMSFVPNQEEKETGEAEHS